MIGSRRRAATFKWLPTRCDGWRRFIEEKVRSPTCWTWCQTTTPMLMEKGTGRLSARAPLRPRVDHAEHERRSHGQNQEPSSSPQNLIGGLEDDGHAPHDYLRPLLFQKIGDPFGPGSRASHRAPASRVSALAGFDPYRGRPAGLTPNTGSRIGGCTIAARSREPWTACATARVGAGPRCEGAPGFGPVTGPCRPAGRSPGAVGSSSQMSSPGNTMPLTRLRSASTARKTLAEPEGDSRLRWRLSRTTRWRTVAGARLRPAANASKQASA